MNDLIKELLVELGIPEDYGQNPKLPIYPECKEIIEVGPNIVGKMQRLDLPTAVAWKQMIANATSDRIDLLLVSGFRSIEYQAELIRKKLNLGNQIEDILHVNVAPGFSQHHTGRAIDIATPGFKPLQEDFEQSEAFAWLTDNASKFGFSMTYPRDNSLLIAYEPWHWFYSN
ncbi:MAG: M15 family metallopeptidase [Pseudomonadota bacterium]|nr:M15 family metallopeptidase [Pseudomonadota bacterium]